MRTKSEASVLNDVRLRAARKGLRLFRNNVGVLVDATGRPVRFGLANDSPALNKALKSADLIGYETLTITADMVGQRIARFLSVECKAPGGRIHPGQQAWADLVTSEGGRAIITSNPDDL